MDMKVICLEEPALIALVEKVVDQIKGKINIRENPWIPEEEAMKMLGITSKTTLQKLRDERAFRFTQPGVKPIMYDRNSILDYLDKYAKIPR